ncbi:hypothetical protein [Methylobacterium nonmethylotrophicum]|uniref:Uncharacterized protein n=1 Tax=Methylobacterium nonmethylotrophicum TaxID=1141884 RepID=A0A4Z0NLD4_9HYPH|nr:hypothetical protein [Methylobacterium nonmethylotrophicum]TGD96318.1 hypothetical protein EU555_24325 [Methylobacterium nonmethylotrophicum]
MRTPFSALALAALLTIPAAARDRQVPPRPVPEDIDATGTVTPTDPLLIPDEDIGPMRRAKRPRDRNTDTEAPIREFIPE